MAVKLFSTSVMAGVDGVSIVSIPRPSLEGTIRGTVVVRGIVAALCGSDGWCVMQPRSYDGSVSVCALLTKQLPRRERA
jgi:hypothetical protein